MGVLISTDSLIASDSHSLAVMFLEVSIQQSIQVRAGYWGLLTQIGLPKMHDTLLHLHESVEYLCQLM